MRQFHKHLTLNLKHTHKQHPNFFSIALPLPLTKPEKNQSLIPPKRRTTTYFFGKILLQKPISQNPILYYKQVHALIVLCGFQSDTFLSNTLISLYSKASNLRYARTLFDRMSERNLISWSSMVSVYSQHGYCEEALMVFIDFTRKCNESVNEYILASVIRACVGLDCGEQVHGLVVKYGLICDVYVGTSLIDFYSKRGGIDEARLVFDGLVEKTAVTWTTMITGYVKSGRSENSLELFNDMKESDVSVIPDRYVLSGVLSACANLKFIEGGKQIHAYVLRRDIEVDISVINVLVDLYTKCGRVKAARKLFDLIEAKNIISWTTMISGYMQNSFDKEAIELYCEMNRLCLKPDSFACSSVLTACSSLQALEQGKQIHAYTIKANLSSDDFVRNSLIDMYAKSDSLIDARRTFDSMTDHNVILYNAMIEGYARQEKLFEAFDLVNTMRLRSFKPNQLTFVSLLGVSAALFALKLSQQIHALVFKFGVSLDLFTGSSLIDVYSKCSLIKDARCVFEEMNEKDIVVWNAMFFGYTQQSENEEALKFYLKLQLSGQKPNDFTFAALITAASNLASLQYGRQVHNQIIKIGLDSDSFLANALADMYAKCGNFEDSSRTFSFTKLKDVVSWNSMISNYAHHGKAEEALKVFDQMIKEGIQPNFVTLVGVLSACSHAGLVEEGLRHFESMGKFGILPGTEHYACMVTLFGRAGKLSEAKEFILKMPIKPAAIVWRSLLSACRIAGDVELGKYAAEMAILTDPTDSSAYILLSNIFASKGMWKDVRRIRERMDFDKVVKEPGRSWMELNNKVHVFLARDKTHCESSQIYSILDDLILNLKGFGYPCEATTLFVND
ncbi:hypothetical protein ACFE04_029538 [Oxalis oulophora]